MPDSCRLLTGECLDVLPTLSAQSVQCCVTSPPYWGLRDYGHEDQLGQERTPSAYVERLVEVFQQVRRVLADDGTVWLNLGDSYASAPPGNKTLGVSGRSTLHGVHARRYRETLASGHATKRNTIVGNLKPKNLIGIPWRVAFALQADGWHLRSDIIWAKPNPMPESVTDRPTRAHEYVFLLTKQARYYYDADAIKEPSITGDMRRPYGSQGVWDVDGRPEHQRHGGQMRKARTNGANKRSVWTIATQPFPGAHFATFPCALVEPCILAGSRPRDTVLDPFAGSGTTGAVACGLDRQFIGIELNADYAAMATARLSEAYERYQGGPLFRDHESVTEQVVDVG